MTAIEWLIEQLQAPCRGIPSHIIEQAKEMEREQIIDTYKKYQSYLIEEFIIQERTYKGITMHKPFEGNSKTFEQWIETYGKQ
jgi:hypothetical protein